MVVAFCDFKLLVGFTWLPLREVSTKINFWFQQIWFWLVGMCGVHWVWWNCVVLLATFDLTENQMLGLQHELNLYARQCLSAKLMPHMRFAYLLPQS